MMIKVCKRSFQLPDFIHDFGEPTPHHPRRSLAIHIALERVLYRVRVTLFTIGDATPGYRFADAFLTLLFGLNCNFPTKDVALYAAWILGLVSFGLEE